jgi:hypothetical protein
MGRKNRSKQRPQQTRRRLPPALTLAWIKTHLVKRRKP